MANLRDALSEIADPRRAEGTRHPLSAVLTLVISGLLCGKVSLTKISKWGRDQTRKNWEAMGFNRRPPCTATLSNILREIEIEDLQDKLQVWLQGFCKTGHHLALDGKTLKGTGDQKNEQLHLLSLFCTRGNLVVKDTDMRDGENEIRAALRLLEATDIRGKVITGDAMFPQKNCAR